MLALALYGPWVSQIPFYYDDYPHFVENVHILHPQTLSDIFRNGFQETRPLYNLSLAGQAFLFGKNAAAGHWINVGLFIIAGALFYRLVLTMAFSEAIAFLSATLFLIHPVAVETVAYMNSRSGLMGVCFSFLALISLFHEKPWRVTLFLILAIASKEDAVGTILVGMMFLALAPHVSAAPQGFKRRMFMHVSGAALALVAIYACFKSPHHGSMGESVAPWYDYLYFQGINLPLHLSTFIFPYPLTFNRDLPRFFEHPLTLAAGWVFILVSLVFLMKRRNHPAALAGLWAILALAPTHSVVPLLDVQATRFLFPALAPMALMLAIVARKVPRAFLVGLCALFIATTTLELALWTQPVALWKKNAAHAPSRWRLWLNLAIEHAERKQWPEALSAVEKAYERAPEENAVIFNRLAIRFSALSDATELSEDMDLYLKFRKDPANKARVEKLGRLLKARHPRLLERRAE